MLTDHTEEIIKLYCTHTQKQIADIYGTYQATIGVLLRKNGIKLRRARRNLSHLALDVDFFKNINTKEKAYWLGFLCADGSIKKTNDKVTLTSKDYEVVQNFKLCIKSGHTIGKNTSIDKRTNKLYESWSIQIGNVLFTNHLLDLGITSKKTDVLNFPNIEEKYYSYFIAGMFDGDGSIFLRKRGKLGINLISTKEVLSFLQNYLYDKYNIKVTKINRVTKNKNNIWKLYLYRDAQKFLEFIYCDTTFPYYLKRKYNKYVEYKKQNIFSIGC